MNLEQQQEVMRRQDETMEVMADSMGIIRLLFGFASDSVLTNRVFVKLNQYMQILRRQCCLGDGGQHGQHQGHEPSHCQ